MNPDFRFITYAASDGLLHIALARSPHNILGIEMLEELVAAIDLAAGDPAGRLLILTSTGSENFCAGVDVYDHVPERAEKMLKIFHAAILCLYNFPLPTLAVLSGAVLGGGCELVLACDMVVAREDVQIGLPEIALGVFPPVAAALLPRRVPSVLAMELLFGGLPVDAAEAFRIGLLNRVLPRDGFAAATETFVAPFLAHSRTALLHAKRAIRASSGQPFDAVLPTLERIYLHDLMNTNDAREGLAAFMEKRVPCWKNA